MLSDWAEHDVTHPGSPAPSPRSRHRRTPRWSHWPPPWTCWGRARGLRWRGYTPAGGWGDKETCGTAWRPENQCRNRIWRLYSLIKLHEVEVVNNSLERVISLARSSSPVFRLTWDWQRQGEAHSRPRERSGMSQARALHQPLTSWPRLSSSWASWCSSACPALWGRWRWAAARAVWRSGVRAEVSWGHSGH